MLFKNVYKYPKKTQTQVEELALCREFPSYSSFFFFFFFLTITFQFSIRVRLISHIPQLNILTLNHLLLSMLFINYFSNKHLLPSVPRVWAFFSHTFCTFISFGCGPSPLAQMCFMGWQEGPFEVSRGPVMSEELERHPKSFSHLLLRGVVFCLWSLTSTII